MISYALYRYSESTKLTQCNCAEPVLVGMGGLQWIPSLGSPPPPPQTPPKQLHCRLALLYAVSIVLMDLYSITSPPFEGERIIHLFLESACTQASVRCISRAPRRGL